MLEEILTEMRGKTWIISVNGLSGTFWTLQAEWYTATGDIGGHHTVYWYDPPLGPP
jgi:hypothetical protein